MRVVDTHSILKGYFILFVCINSVQSHLFLSPIGARKRVFFPQEWTNRTLAVHERVDSWFIVLPGKFSELTITEITEFTYFSLLEPICELNYKSE